ncbi:MAG: aspartate aminotransferase family protein [Pseudomonadales bacterium]
MNDTTIDKGVDAYWMPFTANRDHGKAPRVIVSASGHHYKDKDGREVYDLFSGLWTSGVGHCHPKIVEAVQRQVGELDFSMSFQATNDKAFELAARLVDFAPESFSRCFFTNSGSESADTALKIALAYQQARGKTEKTRLIGRVRGYHGTNFGGISVGGIPANRAPYMQNLMPGVDHIRDTFDLEQNAFSRGQPEHGVDRAEDLAALIAKHGADTIAAVIVEPVAGSTGILPPPVGYLQRLRELCDEHDILLIFDEVITAFGRIGANFGADRFGVTPDIITTAKGLTNGVIPMGAVLVNENVYQQFMTGPEHLVEWFHGYTYSGHPVAAAAGIASLDVYKEEGSIEQARAIEPLFEEVIHSLADHPKVIDVRNFGLMGAIELESRADMPGIRGLETHKKCFWDQQLMIRNGMDILQFAPFLNSDGDELEQAFASLRKVLDSID